MNPNSSAPLRFGQRAQLAGDPGNDLESLSTFQLPDGCSVLVNLTPAIPDFFILLKDDNTTPPDGVNIIQPASGPGRWVRYSFLYAGGGGPVPAIAVSYNDGLAPAYGSVNVQGALDALKPLVATAQGTATTAQTDATTALANAAAAAAAAAAAQTTANTAVTNAATAQATADAAQIDATAALAGLGAKADKTTTMTAGAGMTGGGDLSANRTFDVVANADGSMAVNANDIQVGVLATDAQHGARGGGTQHAVATGAVAGFMAAADKVSLDGDSQTFNFSAAEQTWTKPSGTFRFCEILLIGTGSGGGAGCTGAATNRAGGAGGGGAARSVLVYAFADVPAQLFLTIPDGPAGGTATAGNGNPGGNGLEAFCSMATGSTIAQHLYARSGSVPSGGAGGTSTGQAGAAGGVALTTSNNSFNIGAEATSFYAKPGGTGTNSVTTAAGQNAAIASNSQRNGGTGGGGVPIAGTESKGGDWTATAPLTGLVGGAAGGNAGNPGAQDAGGAAVYYGGTGGGSSHLGTGGAGGAGTVPGCGGGGGAGGATGGAGGKGGPGQATVRCY
jgi:hypothetical protein